MPKNSNILGKARIVGRGALALAVSSIALITSLERASAQSTWDTTTKVEVSVTEQSLENAVRVLAEQFSVEITAPSFLLAGKQSPALTGAYTLQNALDRLLKGSGLKGKIGLDGNATIEKQSNLPSFAQMGNLASANQDSTENIFVTGSRLRKDQFSSPTPLQVFSPTDAQKLGITSVAEILQRTTVANGTQIDASLNTNSGTNIGTQAPPAGGVGSSNIDLRGLGAERTLVLVNGRRMGSGGVRGAPAQPDISLLPIGMVEQIEVVTEGASAIYGADAVAGVVNVILRDEFEGLEITANLERPEATGGRVNQVSLVTGAVGDRSRITFGAEYFGRSRVTTGDRSFSNSERNIYRDESGAIISYPSNGSFDNSVFVFDPLIDNLGNENNFVYYTPGATNLGVSNFSSAFSFPEPDGPCTLEGDEFDYVCFDQYNAQDEKRAADLVQPIERFSAVVVGSYDLDLWSDEKLYFEAYYLNRSQFVIGETEQIFPDIPGEIPIRNSDGTVVGTTDNPLNPFSQLAIPIISLSDVGQNFDVELQQFRFVGGLTGGFGNSNWFADRSWAYDISYSYDRSVGFQSQRVLFEPHLIQATAGVYQDQDTGDIRCGVPFDLGGFGFSTPADCVPFNAFAPSVYATGPDGDGGFSTQAEFDYLTGNRTNRTVVEQSLLQGYMTGDLFEIPGGGTVQMAFGGEWRRDSIASQNSIIGVLGLNSAESPLTEGETNGTRNIWDLYAEISVPLIQGRPGVELLAIDGAVRYTSEEFFGDDVTYRARVQYKPVDYLSLSGSYGTSFRAPNLREQFLAQQANAVSGGLDPCVANTFDNPAAPDAQFAIANCIADGVLFTDTNNDGLPDSSELGVNGIIAIPTVVGGSTDLQAETSRSFTATVSFSQPFTSLFDFDLALSYFDIKVQNAVNEVNPASIISECYTNPQFPGLTSPFCNRITRSGNPDPTANTIALVDSSFLNIGEETARGIDINSRVGADMQTLFGNNAPPIYVSWSTSTSWAIEQEVEIFGPEDRDDNIGEIGFPKFRFVSTASVGYENFEFLLQSRMISATRQDPEDADGPFEQTEIAGSPIVTEVDFTGTYWIHDISLSWNVDAYSLTAGISNVADRDPPLINEGGPTRNNAVTSAGYDLFGRTFFLSGQVRF